MKLTELLAGVALMLPAMVNAQGWYAGVDVGSARSDAKINENVLGQTTARSTETTTAFRLRGGYQIWKWFAVELAYVDFGEVESHFDPDECPPGSPGSCAFDVRTSMSGLLGTLRAIVPIGQHWYVDGRLGWGKMDVHVSEIGGEGLDGDDENTLFQYGIGGGYRINEHWEIALEFSEYNQEDFGETLTGEFGLYNLGESSVTSLGVAYRW